MANREPIGWITVKGRRVPLFEGESKEESIKNALNKDADTKAKQIKANESKKSNSLFDDPYMQKAMKNAGVTEKDWDKLSNDERYKIANDAYKMQDRAEKRAEKKAEKQKQIDQNKKEADRKNAEEKQFGTKQLLRNGKPFDIDKMGAPRAGANGDVHIKAKDGKDGVLVSTMKPKNVYGTYVGKPKYELYYDKEKKREVFDKWEDTKQALKRYFK